jgi:hypothetical protein
MAFPASDTAIQRPDLGVLVDEYMESEQALMGFIGTQVMPLLPVAESTANYPVMPKEVMLKMQDTKRAMRGKYPRSDWEWEEGFYATSENGWEEAVDDRERKLYGSKFDAEAIASRRAVGIIERRQEKRIADIVFNGTNFTANSITHEWDDPTNAVPITDVATGKLSIRSACGMLPNVLIIAYSTFLNLKACDSIVDLLKYTFPGIDINQMSLQQLAQVLDVPRILVGGAVYDSAKKGQVASIADLWDNEYAMLTRISNSGQLTEPCVGRTFLWTEESGGGHIVESYRDETVRGDVIRVRHDTSEALIASRDSDLAIKSNLSTAVSYLMDNITT